MVPNHWGERCVGLGARWTLEGRYLLGIWVRGDPGGVSEATYVTGLAHVGLSSVSGWVPSKADPKTRAPEQ